MQNRLERTLHGLTNVLASNVYLFLQFYIEDDHYKSGSND